MFQSLLPRRKKPEEEEHKTDNSLLARAFSGDPAAKASLSKAPVAVYKDPYAKLRRQALRVLLTIVLPIVGLALIGFVVFNTVASNIKEPPTTAETITMGNVPVPGGVRKVNGVLASGNPNYFLAQATAWLPGFNFKVVKVEGYLANLSPFEILNYYKSKFTGKDWQVKQQQGLVNSYDIFYLHGLPNKGLEGVYLQVQGTIKDDFKKIADPDNGTAFVIAKLTISPRR